MISTLIAETHFNESTRVVCPFCSPERRKQNSKDMTLTRKPDGAVVYHCHHCFEQGSVQIKERSLSAVPTPSIIKQSLEQAHYDWLDSRGISPKTADKMKLFASEKFFTRLGKTTSAVGFPYFRGGALVAAKYRSIEAKDFTQDSGGAHDFFGIDIVEKGKPLIIVEGELDCLTALQAGLENVVSVPSGAPVKVADGKVLPSEDKKFAFVWNAREILDAAPYVILATDQDIPGQALAEELARRIGKDKCRLAKFNKKDLNEVWNDIGEDDPSRTIREIIDSAVPYPVNGLSMASDFKDRLNDLYAKGTGKGFSTGFNSIDEIYTVAPAQLTVVTGYPSSGKSNFVDQVMVNLARANDWKFAICSFENQPEIHISRLMEIYTQKRFFDGRDRMGQDEKDQAFKWVQDHFLIIDTNGEEPSTLDSILERARVAVKRMGIRGLIIDPYNYIELERKDSTETEAISSMLTRVQKFCKATDVHTFFVAHPSKINRSGVEQPRPDGMSISGSMAWWAKTDCGLTVHRGKGAVVEIAVWKCRYRWCGTQGESSLLYNKTSGTYSENLDQF
jgi:twinkle protein